ncbi:MCM-domain-containing protein [Coemansia reversa NRRL 1564]|uniref:DNA helicase n=1 Tax=Coemansia reversa (strain ATCC 12441 / NRRL 1564) TaxID=763665 RepID=A0A2G5BH31_COERN|nr:MCM-domain-containing protein [Coemansia reversa NRRL 1564]|eukprot:PIA18334.1 MCM-domain-containing protein [Coemansia reversa NRRL 1564]
MSLPPRRNSDEDHFGKIVPESLAGTKRPNIGTDDSASLNRIGRYWQLYFPRQEIDTASKECIEDIKKFASYLQAHPESFSMDTDVSCLFDYPTLLEASPVTDFSQRIFNEPQHLLCCLGLAVCCVLSSEYGPDAEHILGDHKLHIHLLHHEPLTHMKSLKSSLVGKLVTVRGTVVRTSPIKPLLVQAQFNCARCGASQTVKIVEGNYEVPVKCITQGCKSRVFEVERGVETGTRTVDWQQIRIQEKINDDPRDPGRVPRSIDAELLNDLVDTVVPGDVVNCTGIVKVMQSDEGKGKGRPNSLYILYLDTVAIDKVGGSSNNTNGSGSDNLNDSAPVPTEEEMTTKDGIHFSNKDLQFIRKVYKEPKLFRLLVHSFSPAIFGHEMVKAGIMLALFGARKRLGSERGSIDIRSDLHVLVVGDPGLGKSQMLTAVGQIAPRGVYVCGTSGISTSGLTVTLVKEAGSGDFALEAGALVLSDMGCCAIDEFDKVSSEHSSLLEAMEQQSISIAKGGLVCSLPARTSVIAAANPAGGHYNKAKTVAENLKISSALLSRFDLVFILLDRPDVDMDKFLSEHVMALHSGSTLREAEVTQASQYVQSGVNDDGGFSADGEGNRLRNWLRLQPGEKVDVIPPSLMRKYVAYARKYVQPRLSAGATRMLREFYLELRKTHRRIDSMPITTRQLEALVRLAEARARAELREIVTESDAENVIEIMRYSLFQTYEDEEGLMDFGRSQMGTGVSGTSDIKR